IFFPLQTVQKINAIFIAKRGKKRWKKSLSHSPEANLQRGPNTFYSPYSPGHAQRMARLRALRKRSSACTTLERELFEWRERQLFESFIVVGLKRKHSGKAYQAEITYQFPKVTAVLPFINNEPCFPIVLVHLPVFVFSIYLFSFIYIFIYGHFPMPSGKAPLLPEVYCILSRLGCFALFSKVKLLVASLYPFCRISQYNPFSSPFFLTIYAFQLIKLRRPSDSRLEHVDFSCLLRCLGVRQLLRLFASLLMERRVIFTADKLSTLSQCGHAAVAMLYPFSWQHTYVPVLPVSMLDIACSPTPFLLGVLSNALPRLRELPLEEAIVNLSMDDEDSILPRKLQAALVQVLEQRSELFSISISPSDGEPGSELNNLASEVFVRFLVEVVGHYSRSLVVVEQGLHEFQREAFRKAVASRGLRRFLELFMQTQMFAGFVQERELGRNDMQGLFELRAAQFLEESPGGEQSGVNRFLRGLGAYSQTSFREAFVCFYFS
uniref:UDENN domain-containing protein n=1 Tax=Eptatretus burgeri TaxID=7764 RepID=A0A8C4QCD3_EPTBU